MSDPVTIAVTIGGFNRHHPLMCDMPTCPTCPKEFDTSHGMKVHHKFAHGESLAKKECTCENCDKTFEEFQSRIERGKGRFCSKECKYDHGRITVTCDYCEAAVEKTKNRAGRYRDKHYCSRECYQAAVAAQSNADPCLEREEWEEYRVEALERDGYECVVCGMTMEEHKDEHGRELHVHHKIPYGEFDEAEEAHELDNLTTLCTRCHRHTEPTFPHVDSSLDV